MEGYDNEQCLVICYIYVFLKYSIFNKCIIIIIIIEFI